ncbi:MAG: S-layer homology domain-containing protein [Synergistaceae bacterium]|jgi:opacity protein-like surface antigen|nr:S-layer homology domain-containing protein [Synergistaceae bacterium]
MRKFKVLSGCLWVLLLFATAGMAATNPFMDVPLNHWSYDAIGQLAAQGILSGYPDGTYKGKQPTTRYEMASALARALAVVDMTKADNRDVEILKKLVVEFSDELDMLGVKVDQVDKRLARVEERLGGWKLSGELRLDLEEWENGEQGTYMGLARLEFQRWFGEDESIFFYARLEEDGGQVLYDKFYADFPFFWETTVTVGRFERDFEGDYRFQIGGATDISNESWLTDRTVDGIAFAKSFGLGSFNFYVAHPADLPLWEDEAIALWELAALAQLQFTEQFALDIGAQGFFGDDGSETALADYDFKVDSLWTLFAGLRFNFNEAIGVKGIYYYQDSSVEENSSGDWQDVDMDSGSAWKVIVDVKQDLLKFTSLWLEYGQVDGDFYLPTGNLALTLDNWDIPGGSDGFTAFDMQIWRVGATQQWNEKWSTWLYVSSQTFEEAGDNIDAQLLQWGLGVEYQYNENVTFALGYIHLDWDEDAESLGDYTDDHRVQFRTAVVF